MVTSLRLLGGATLRVSGAAVWSVGGGQQRSWCPLELSAPGGPTLEDDIPRDLRTPWDEFERNDGPVGEALAPCRKPDSLVATVVDTSDVLSASTGKSAVVRKLERCSSRRKEGSILV